MGVLFLKKVCQLAYAEAGTGKVAQGGPEGVLPGGGCQTSAFRQSSAPAGPRWQVLPCGNVPSTSASLLAETLRAKGEPQGTGC